MIGVPVKSIASAPFSAEGMSTFGRISWEDYPPLEICKQGLIICSCWQAGKKEIPCQSLWITRKKIQCKFYSNLFLFCNSFTLYAGA